VSIVFRHPRPAVAVTAFAAGAALLLSSCGTSDSPAPPGAPDAAEETTLGHVHGLGVDPADGTLYVASHSGVFRIADDGTERVADRWQDTMGFAVAGPGHFLGSGHPDLRERLPSSLGLIESTDRAETWKAVSLSGDADLHAIEPVGERIYAYDAVSGSLLMTIDRKDWTMISTQPVYDLAANPAELGTVYATTGRGAFVRSVDGQPPRPVPGAPTLTAIDWEPDGPLVGVAPDGTVMTSTDAIRWQERLQLDGPAQALDAVDGRWHAATESGVYESGDDGRTWQPLVLHDH
jgi:hypothetical protein